MARDHAEAFQFYLAWAIQRANRGGLPDTALSRASGIPPKTLARALNCEGTLNLGQLQQIAKALNVPMSALILDAESLRREQPAVGALYIEWIEQGLSRRERAEHVRLYGEVSSQEGGGTSGANGLRYGDGTDQGSAAG